VAAEDALGGLVSKLFRPSLSVLVVCHRSWKGLPTAMGGWFASSSNLA
jgi:hypothetical protein